MCFKSKVSTPKTDPESLKAPEPVLIEEPKGVDFGASEDNQSTTSGTEGLKVEKTATDKGDGSSSATASDTGSSPSTNSATKKANAGASIKRALK